MPPLIFLHSLPLNSGVSATDPPSSRSFTAAGTVHVPVVSGDKRKEEVRKWKKAKEAKAKEAKLSPGVKNGTKRSSNNPPTDPLPVTSSDSQPSPQPSPQSSRSKKTYTPSYEGIEPVDRGVERFKGTASVGLVGRKGGSVRLGFSGKGEIGEEGGGERERGFCC